MSEHARLIAKWSVARFTVKKRVNNDDKTPSQQTASNIRKNPKHSDSHGIKALIKSIDKHSQSVTNEVIEMNNKIQSI